MNAPKVLIKMAEKENTGEEEENRGSKKQRREKVQIHKTGGSDGEWTLQVVLSSG